MITMRSSKLLAFFARWVAGTLAIYAVAWLLPGIVVEDFAAAIWAGLALGLLNAFLRPLLIFFTLPATIVTLGLFILVINAFILYLVGELVAGVEIRGFGSAFLGALLISLLSSVLYALIGPEEYRVRVELRRGPR